MRWQKSLHLNKSNVLPKSLILPGCKNRSNYARDRAAQEVSEIPLSDNAVQRTVDLSDNIE